MQGTSWNSSKQKIISQAASIQFPTILKTSSSRKYKNDLSLIQNLTLSQIPRIQENPPVFQLATNTIIDQCFDVIIQAPSWPFEYVGFDTETTIFRPNNPRMVSMIQIATRELCLIFQVYRVSEGDKKKFPCALADFLNNPAILKVGVNASGDADWLKESYGITCRGIVNLEDIAKKKGIQAKSLSELTLMFADPGLVLEKTKSKLRKWNFDAFTLDKKLVQYAAADAFAGFQIYSNMLEGKRNPDYKTWAQRFPMTREDEEEEIYTLISKNHKKDKPIEIEKLINFLQFGYGRWGKTIPNAEIRRKEAITTILKYISQNRIIHVQSTEIQKKNDDMENESIKFDENTKQFPPRMCIKLPGISLETLIASKNAISFFEQKGLSEENRSFLKEIMKFMEKPMRRKNLVQNYKNSGAKQYSGKDDVFIGKKLEQLLAKGAFISTQNDKGTIQFNPVWEKMLEQSYNDGQVPQKGEIEILEDQLKALQQQLLKYDQDISRLLAETDSKRASRVDCHNELNQLQEKLNQLRIASQKLSPSSNKVLNIDQHGRTNNTPISYNNLIVEGSNLRTTYFSSNSL
ncbi:hypothetical protein G9A89_005352 [Geosiphon pyriformis]|nr:hypothetical protein G9A89_005352 [Geosiphon pyriformis]